MYFEFWALFVVHKLSMEFFSVVQLGFTSISISISIQTFWLSPRGGFGILALWVQSLRFLALKSLYFKSYEIIYTIYYNFDRFLHRIL